MRKKMLSLTLALVMCLGLLPTTASALSNDTFEYTLSGDEVYITKLLDQSIEDLVIPSTIAGKPVTVVDRLRDCPNLKSVLFPASVKKIGRGCLQGSHSVTSVTLPEGLETIGEFAFRNCSLETVILPDSVTKIENGAFDGNRNLISIKLPSKLTTISRNMLSRCPNLKEIELPDTVNTLEWQCFYQSGLERITIPKGVKTIPYNGFADMPNLKEVDLPSGLTSISAAAFYNSPSLTNIFLPVSLTSVDLEAFGRTGITTLILPYGITNVSGTMRSDKPTEIYVPSTVERISVNSNCLVYCMPDSKLAEGLSKDGKTSYATDASCDTRINVLYKGKRVSFGAYGQNPEIVNSRTMVPLRSIFEAMGAQVQWDGATQTVTATRGSDKIVMTVGQNGYTVGGAAKTMDTPPMILNERTMVPVRVVAESFGADVTWHAASATVIITE